MSDFPGSSEDKASAYSVGNTSSIPQSGRSPGEGNGNPLRYSCLPHPPKKGGSKKYLASLVVQTVKRLPTMRETWFQRLGRENLLEKEMETHSSIPAWKIPWMEEPSRLESMG